MHLWYFVRVLYAYRVRQACLPSLGCYADRIFVIIMFNFTWLWMCWHALYIFVCGLNPLPCVHADFWIPKGWRHHYGVWFYCILSYVLKGPMSFEYIHICGLECVERLYVLWRHTHLSRLFPVCKESDDLCNKISRSSCWYIRSYAYTFLGLYFEISRAYWDSHNYWPRSARVIYSSARVSNCENLLW